MPKSATRLKLMFPKMSLIAGLLALISTVSAEENLTLPGKADQLDWYAYDELPDQLKEKVLPGCLGLYIDPLSNSLTPDSEFNQDLVIEADQAELINGQKATIYGEVTVQQGNKKLTSGSMSYDRETDSAILKDGVSIRQPGLLIYGEQAHVEFQNNTSEFKKAKFVYHKRKLRGSASSIQQLNKNEIVLNDGAMTGCEPGSNGWSLEGDKIVINNEKNQGYGKNIRLKIGSVPILYLPYISFPVGKERQSGFLFPSISSSEDGGLDIAVPYYWNMASNYDSTITPRIISGRGFMLETEFRHLNNWVNSELRGGFLPNDSGTQDADNQDLVNNSEASEEEVNPHKGNNRWLIQFQQKSEHSVGWYIDNDFTRVSDLDYFRDLGTSSISIASNSQLDQSFLLGYRSHNWDINVLTEKHQLLLKGISNNYQKLPQINLNSFYRLGPVSTSFAHEITQFQTDDANIIEGDRFYLDYRLGRDNRTNWGFFNPEIGFKYLSYNLQEPQGSSLRLLRENIQHNATQFSVDTGITLERPRSVYTQTLQPRIFYLFREYDDQSDMFDVLGDQNINFDTFTKTFSYNQLFSDSRFTGHDRLDDANQITLGLSSSFYHNKTGDERLRLSFGKIYYLDDRRVVIEENSLSDRTTSSELALETAIQLNNNSEVILTGVYDNREKHTTRSSLHYHYANSDYAKIFNFAYAQVRGDQLDAVEQENIEQIDLSSAIKVSNQWSIMSRINYDIQNTQELESFLGIEYDDCCYRVRVLARKWLDSNIASIASNNNGIYDRGLFFEIHLKGLGGSGAKVNAILNNGIFGYKYKD